MCKLVRIIRTLENKKFALGKSEGGKRGWGDGQYYWVNYGSHKTLNFYEQDALNLINNDFLVPRRYANDVVRVPFEGEFSTEDVNQD
jgi:hypothetical protein